MILSINPWYYCNFRCKFCYLTEQQLSDKKLLELDRLNEIISEISQHENIDKVDLYGGELGLLPKQYWNDLITLLNIYSIDDINLITNLSMINDITLDDRVYTTVSYDFNAREDSDRVFKNMALLNKPFSILVLASTSVMDQDVDEMINMFNMLENLVSVEIKPYSSNQANQFNISHTSYEEFVKKWILNTNKNFIFVNESLLKTVLDKTRNSFSDDHVYITPNGKYSVLEFDLNDNEFFLEYDTLEEYWQWCDKEKNRVGSNKYCSNCEYYGNCLTEHYRHVVDLKQGCNGYKGLITWYENNRS